MQLLMVLSGYFPFIPDELSLTCAHFNKSHRPNTRLEIILVDIYDTPDYHHLAFQEVAHENVYE